MALIQQNVSLHDKNWFQTGGTAQYFAQPTTDAAFQEALAFAHQHHLDITIIGQGANVLISDEGVQGLVIRPGMNSVRIVEETPTHAHVEIGAGLSMHDAIIQCLEHRLAGLEEFSGIPGTIGGSVYINLHYFEFLLEQFLVNARVIDRTTGMITTVDREWFHFAYDQSTLMAKTHYLVSATFRLKKLTESETYFAQGRRTEIIRHRAKRYPTTHTCGSFFRNFHPNEVEQTERKLIFTAYYLDKIGVKGSLRYGGAVVSHQHANMIVNQHNASSNDIVHLARQMQELVHKNFGIVPQPECQLIGFQSYPLYKP